MLIVVVVLLNVLSKTVEMLLIWCMHVAEYQSLHAQLKAYRVIRTENC